MSAEPTQIAHNPTFIDTEVLVFAHNKVASENRTIARKLLEELWHERAGVLSAQVLQEFYFVATRRLDPPLDAVLVRKLLAAYGAWPVVPTDAVLLAGASELEERHSVPFRDALVLEAARRLGATRILTGGFPVGRGRSIAGIDIEDPFLPASQQVAAESAL